jgi:AcrR family transcriptional regulator
MPAAFKERERNVIRERLIAAAMDALRLGGLDASSVADLVKAASIAKGSFYSFFNSKEELFMEALESIEDTYRARFAEAADGEGSAEQRLKRAFRAAFDAVIDEPALAHIDSSTMERLARALPVERLQRHMEHDATELASTVAVWRAGGLIGAGVGDDEIAGACYAVFIVASGMRTFPESQRTAIRDVTVRGLALSLSQGIAAGPARRGPEHDCR